MSATVELIFEGVDNASDTVAGIERNLSGMVDGVSKKMLGFGESMTTMVSLPIAAGLGLAAHEAIGFETAMAGVSKVAGFTGDEMATLETEIMQLSRTIPKSQKELAGLAKAAASVGIGPESIGEFITLTSEMSVAFDIEAKKVGDSAKEIVNSFQMIDDAGAVDFARLRTFGDTVNTLAGSMATTEADIMNATQRMSGVGSLFGFSEGEIAGIAAGFTSLGEAPEVAASAFNALASRLSQATSLSDDAKAGFDNLGLSAEDMEKKFLEGNGTEAFMEFLSAVKAEGPEAGKAVGDIVGSGYANNILGAAGSLNEFEKALNGVASVVQDGGGIAMADSFEIMANTTEAQMAIAKNALTEIAITIGSEVLPVVNQLLAAIIPVAAKFADFTAANPQVVQMGVAFLGLLAAIGPIAIALAKVTTAVKILAVGFGVVGAAMKIAAVGAFTFMAPLLPLVGAILLVVAAGWALMQIFKLISAVVASIDWSGIASGLRAEIDQALAAVDQFAFELAAGFMNGANEAIAAVQGMGGQINSFLSGLASQASAWGSSLMSSFGAGLAAGANAALAPLRNLAAQARALMPGSDAETGPLSDITQTGPGLVNAFADGIRKSSGGLMAEMDRLSQGARDHLQGGGGDDSLTQLSRAQVSGGGNQSGGGGVTINYAPTINGDDDGNLAVILREHSREIADMVRREFSRSDSLRYNSN